MKKNNRKLYGYQTTNRAKHNLNVHLILVCKYRKKLLEQGIEANIKDIIRDTENNSDFDIIEMETDIDHIHLMIQYIPKVSISSIINRVKSITTKRIWNLHQQILQKHFWKEKTFWTDGYFVCSVGEASPETIQNYIKNQG
jgi:putative transposase